MYRGRDDLESAHAATQWEYRVHELPQPFLVQICRISAVLTRHSTPHQSKFRSQLHSITLKMSISDPGPQVAGPGPPATDFVIVLHKAHESMASRAPSHRTVRRTGNHGDHNLSQFSSQCNRAKRTKVEVAAKRQAEAVPQMFLLHAPVCSTTHQSQSQSLCSKPQYAVRNPSCRLEASADPVRKTSPLQHTSCSGRVASEKHGPKLGFPMGSPARSHSSPESLPGSGLFRLERTEFALKIHTNLTSREVPVPSPRCPPKGIRFPRQEYVVVVIVVVCAAHVASIIGCRRIPI
eukprot:jgi/Botrbrau1/9189/Bobra.0236s0018.1